MPPRPPITPIGGEQEHAVTRGGLTHRKQFRIYAKARRRRTPAQVSAFGLCAVCPLGPSHLRAQGKTLRFTEKTKENSKTGICRASPRSKSRKNMERAINKPPQALISADVLALILYSDDMFAKALSAAQRRAQPSPHSATLDRHACYSVYQMSPVCISFKAIRRSRTLPLCALLRGRSARMTRRMHDVQMTQLSCNW